MKIVLDLQGTQSNSRYRGIGRYSLSMAKAFAEVASRHELWLALNGLHLDAAVDLVEEFSALVPRERILVNELPQHIAGCFPGNRPRAQVAEAAQAHFFDALHADCIWHSSMFEGWGDDSIVTLGSGSEDRRHAATLYDLIPMLHPERHLYDAHYRLWYYRRLGLLKRCGLLLAISESSRREAIENLSLDPSRVAVVSAASNAVFKPTRASEEDWARWQRDLGIRPGFLLYAGGYDAHKNVDGLLVAYAELPPALKQRHLLVLVGKCDAEAEQQLRTHARRHGLNEGGVIFTGAIDDTELAKLYTSCELFVAPSLHEGFGLPALEAMACGAAVVGSSTASLPEVIGREDALFNPRSRSSIGAKLQEVLSDTSMRARLREHGLSRSRQFSWHNSAKRALEAIEQHAPSSSGAPLRFARPRLIYVSPLPPARSGIADYSARLLRDLASYYDIDVVVEQPEVGDLWTKANFPIRSVDWLLSPSNAGVRVLYHMGNSPLHAHMFSLLERRPGVVALHDSFLGAVRNWMAADKGDDRLFQRVLFASHGYPALWHDRRHGRVSTMDTYPVNLDVIDQAIGVLVHSRHAVELAQKRYGARAAARFAVAPFPKAPTRGDRRMARRFLGIAQDDFVVCSFGMLAPTKLNHRLLAAWLQSSLAKDPRCHLIFVGENHGGDYGAELLDTLRRSACRSRIHITGFVDENRYREYLMAADAAVQLRTASRGETSAAIFDVLGQGLPLIVNAHGSAQELPSDVVLRIDDLFSDDALAGALQRLKDDASARQQLSEASVAWIGENHHPSKVAARYRDVIEDFAAHSIQADKSRLLADLQHHATSPSEGAGMRHDARKFMAINGPRLDRPRLFVDVTATSVSKLHTGIERVVRGVLTQLLDTDSTPWRIEPVRLVNGRYVRALSYALHLIDHPDIGLAEEEVHPQAGDVLLGLDWVADALPANTAVLDAWRIRGVRMIFVVYDLLPVRTPQWFPEGIASMHAQWLQCIGKYADGLIGISKSVIEDLRSWFDQHPPVRQGTLPLGYFYPGSDLLSTRPTEGLPGDVQGVLSRMCDVPTFLMVGTIEPRKGHAFVLDAFERLWASGVSANLVVVGRQGWMSEALVARMRNMVTRDAGLIWLEQASDEYLEHLYAASRALVAASEAEGFGLPLVEAARRGLPVIARDIPVFREVSSGFARYFDGHSLDSLVGALRAVLLDADDVGSKIEDTGLTWRSTTLRLQEMLGDADHPQWLCAWQRDIAQPSHSVDAMN
jgi:glycosyltransferase involved in cell wall biosynthesis